ncbi:DsbA family protein [Variovorax sp. RHLX14]|uniref:DsbA family protein n=1 Tax=Variovorax sp. RHLX14 TaxID=1259731 RepID=UPI003F46F864
MNKTLHYFYDPMCGWCYGATPAVSDLSGTAGLAFRLLPTGLFSGGNARQMDDAFAAFAWSNDQRIERLTGQRFTEEYRRDVLGDRRQLFDSGPATIALTAVSLTEPEKELVALKAIQHARYVAGKDVTSPEVLVHLLEEIGLPKSAARLARIDEDLHAINQGRISKAQLLMTEMGARGVPTLILQSGERMKLLDTAAFFTNPPDLNALTSQLQID